MAELLHCPHCEGALSVGSDGWVCRSCQFASDGIDFRLQKPKQIQLGFVIGSKIDWQSRLEKIDTSRPVVSFAGPNGKRDSRELLSVVKDATEHLGILLDLGCGPRDQQVPVESLGHRYVGVDYSSKDANYLADAHALPFRDASFDFVLSYAVFEHLYNPFAAIAQVERVLKPGGLFVGTVSLGEPFHESFFHHSAWGLISLLDSSHELEIVRLWSALDTLRSLSRMGRYSRPIRSALGWLDAVNRRMPWLSPRKARRPIKEKQVDALHRCGSIAFVVRKKERKNDV